MTVRAACAAVLLACLLAGCGGGAKASTATGASGPSSTADTAAIATACGDLRARLQGIAGTRGVRDPQPAALEIHKVVREMKLASTESIAANQEIEAELRRAGSPAASIAALRRGSRRFRRYVRLLTDAPPSGHEGIHVQVRLLALDAAEVRACAAGARRP